MTIASVPHGDRDLPAAFEAGCRPLSQLSNLGADQWLALGDDPQFLLTWGRRLVAGPYRITLTLEAGDAASPCIYLDRGDGWSEDTRQQFEPEASGTRWTLLTWLSDDGPARLDPIAQPGRFRLGSVLVEPLAESEALLTSLVRRISGEPGSAAAEVQQAFLLAASHGFQSCWTSLNANPSGASAINGRISYLDWIRRFDTLSSAQCNELRAAIAQLPRRPMISLILLIGDASEHRVRACIDSIVAQLYADWELCLLLGGPRGSEMDCMLAGYVERHSRIRLVDRVDDQPLATLLDQAVAAAQGQFVGVLGDAPVLPRHSLLAFADAIIGNPDATILYSDADCIEGAGHRVDPYFKPDWNPDLFLSQDYLNPFALYAIALARDAGCPRGVADDALLQGLALRCLSRAAVHDSGIVHLGLVLCHARTRWDDGSTRDARRQMLVEHLAADAAGIEVESIAWGHAIRRPLTQPVPKVSLIIPTRDRLDLLRRCVDSICSLSTYTDFEVVIVDNQSSEPATLDYFASLQGRSDVRVLAFDAPFNYSTINNYAVAKVDGEIVGLINNDIEVISPDWLEQMVQHALRTDIGAVGAMLYYPDDTIQHAGVIVGLGGVAGHPYLGMARGTPGQMGRATLVQNLSAVTGACLLVRRSKYLDVGGLNERLSVAFNDVDFCLRLQARGWRNLWTPFAELYHHESASRGIEDTPEKRARFHAEIEYMAETWGDLLSQDSAYNASLSLLHDDAFQLSPTPRQSALKWARDFTRGKLGS